MPERNRVLYLDADAGRTEVVREVMHDLASFPALAVTLSRGDPVLPHVGNVAQGCLPAVVFAYLEDAGGEVASMLVRSREDLHASRTSLVVLAGSVAPLAGLRAAGVLANSEIIVPEGSAGFARTFRIAAGYWSALNVIAGEPVHA